MLGILLSGIIGGAITKIIGGDNCIYLIKYQGKEIKVYKYGMVLKGTGIEDLISNLEIQDVQITIYSYKRNSSITATLTKDNLIDEINDINGIKSSKCLKFNAFNKTIKLVISNSDDSFTMIVPHLCCQIKYGIDTIDIYRDSDTNELYGYYDISTINGPITFIYFVKNGKIDQNIEVNNLKGSVSNGVEEFVDNQNQIKRNSYKQIEYKIDDSIVRLVMPTNDNTKNYFNLYIKKKKSFYDMLTSM